jgi:dolichol-phosphate mannosyltransferase
MPPGRKLIVLLPAYNEEASLDALLGKILSLPREQGELIVLACNDGSRDGTGTILSRRAATDARVQVLEHKINRGLGETIRDLFEAAAEIVGDDDVIVRLDADDTHEPRRITAMIEKLDEGYDVVIASRFQPGGAQLGLDAYRRFISLAANIFMRVMFHVPNVHEYSCGFRAYRAALIRRAIEFYGNDFIQLKGVGFTCTLEKLVKLYILGARFGEVPFTLHYDRKLSSSKMIGSITTLGYLLLAILYHWPWGGWRRYYRTLLKSASRDDGR